MITKSKMNIVAGVLLVVYTVFRFITIIVDSVLNMQTIPIFLGPALLALYCFAFSKKRIGVVFYVIGYLSVAFVNIKSIILNSGYLGIYYILSSYVALVVFVILAIVGKVKMNKVLFIGGIVILCVYAYRPIAAFVSLLSYGQFVRYFSFDPLWALSYIYEMFYPVALFFLWIYENSIAAAKAKIKKEKSLEEKLTAIEQAYQAGQISQEEYTEKRTAIINKL